MKLLDRYPEIQFLLNISDDKPCRLCENEEQLKVWFDSQKDENLEIIYIIGLIGYSLPKSIYKWLEKSPERALIFIESRLGAFISFKQNDLVSNAQIHFVYGTEEVIENLARQYPSQKVEVYEGRKFDSLTLKRRSAAYSALYLDVLYSHKIVENVLYNMSRLDEAFIPKGDFSSIPLLICGAGPSLEMSMELLSEYQNRAIILAVGSGISAITKKGIIPHIAMALDPNDEEFHHLAQGRYFEGPFIFSPRLHRDVWTTLNGPFGFLQSDTGGFIESYLETALKLDTNTKYSDLGSEAFSVTTLALSWACTVGFSNIALIGIDLSFADGKHYAFDIETSKKVDSNLGTLNQIIEFKNVLGKKCQTLIKWLMEADVISAFSASHPEIQITNCSMKGLEIKGVLNCELEKWISKFSQKDIRGYVHQFVHQNPAKIDQNLLKKIMKSLSLSLDKCQKLCEKILQEKSTGKKILFADDFQAEPAYEALLEGVDKSLERLLVRYYPHLDDSQMLNKRELAKYEEIIRQITLFSKIFRRLAKN